MCSVAFGQLDRRFGFGRFAVGFAGNGIYLTRGRGRSSLVIKGLRFLIHDIESRQIHFVGSECLKFNSLRIIKVSATPSVFLAEHNKPSVAQPFPFIEKAVVHEILLTLLFIEKVRDS